uniref:CUB domain-containing protein n=1 Tax=Biomphalaria glabrata TaxID=6526 RepID=A0A2C9KKQ8_BIOGL
MSSNYPLTYPYDSKCTWTITSNNVNSIISLRFQDYEVEGCPYDYVELFDGDSSSAKQLDSLCYSVPEVIKSSGNSMHIVFTSDNSNNKKGFLATYAIEDFCKQKRCSHTCKVTSTNPWTETCTCPEWMTLDSSGEHCYVTNACNSTIQSHSGYIVSPNYPHNYLDSTTCFWRIEGGINSRVTLRFAFMFTLFSNTK